MAKGITNSKIQQIERALESGVPALQRPTGGHLATLPYYEDPAFKSELRAIATRIPSNALEICIPTATRTSESRAMAFTEEDWTKAVWVIAPKRSNAGHKHRVPLSPKKVKNFERNGSGPLWA